MILVEHAISVSLQVAIASQDIVKPQFIPRLKSWVFFGDFYEKYHYELEKSKNKTPQKTMKYKKRKKRKPTFKWWSKNKESGLNERG